MHLGEGKRTVSAALAIVLALPPQAWALPTGGAVVAGSVATSVNGGQMTLNQGSRAAIMNWQQFNVAPGELVRILQGGADAAMLARVIGGNPSAILGQIKADGKLFLINPRGIVVGAGAVIDTAAFTASTLDVSDQDFLAGRALTFKGSSDAGVVNLGRITAREGNVLLIAHKVKNEGEISAPNGTAGLAAGTEVFLASPDAPAFVVRTNLVAAAPGTTGVENTGTIAAAQAQLEAAGGSIYDLAVNQSGVVRATGVETRPDGRVLITAQDGTLGVGGTVSARNADGSGGTILVGGGYQGKNPEVANAARTAVLPQALLDANAEHGDGGRVIVWADDATRHFGSIEAKGGSDGGNGGFAEVSGKHSLVFTGSADLGAPQGAPGTLLLDPTTLTIVAGTTSLPAALNTAPFEWFATDNPGSQTLGAASLSSLLRSNNVTLQATDRLTVDAAIAASSGNRLSLTSSDIRVNQGIDLGTGVLQFFDLASGPGSHSLNSAAGATLKAATVESHGFQVAALDGSVQASLLRFENITGTATRLQASNAANSISKLEISTDSADPQTVTFTDSVSVASSSAMSVRGLFSAVNTTLSASGGNLTLLGADLGAPAARIAASGTTKLAASGGGVFVNQAGASLLSGTGRRLLYTSNTGGAFALGGLAGYTQVDDVAFPSDPSSASSRVLYVAPAPTASVVTTFNADQTVSFQVRSLSGNDTQTTQTATFSTKSLQQSTTDPQTTVVLYEKNGTTDVKLQDFIGKADTSVQAGLKAGSQITPALLGQAVIDLGADLLKDLAALAKDELARTPDRKQGDGPLLEALRDGKMSSAQLATLVQTDSNLRSAVMAGIASSLLNAVQSGKPLTAAESSLASRIAANINTSREVYAQELQSQRVEFLKAKADVGANNPFALKTMDDIALSAQQAATERSIGLAIGAGAGLALGAATAAILNISSVAAAVLPHVVTLAPAGVVLGEGVATAAGPGIVFSAAQFGVESTLLASPAAGISAASAASVIGVAIGLVVVGVQAGIMVAQEQKNINAYNAALDKAGTKLDLNLAKFDLKNDANKAEYLTGFMMTMLETGYK